MKRSFIFILVICLVAIGTIGCKANEKEKEKAVSNTEKAAVKVAPVAKDATDKGYVYKHRDTAAGGNDREAYIWEVMKTALDATEKDYGSYVIQPVQDINQEREDYEVIHDTGIITVISDSLNQNNLDNLSLLKFPVMRDLLGYRVFLIDKNRKEEFSKINTLDDLKKYQFGIGIGWNDKIVLNHAGLKVYEETEYKMLFKDVSTGVIDIFSRGINEVVDEYNVYSKQYNNLIIDDHVLLYYPLPRYFWFSKSSYGEKLKTRLDVGLKRIVENGKLEEIFNRYFKDDVASLNLKNRVLIKLENPIYTEEYKKNDQPYNFDPFQ